MIHQSPEYDLIHAFYDSKVAKRSQVPLINHIDEGLDVLNCLDASESAKRAYCLHPLLQNDSDLINTYSKCCDISSTDVIMLAMEYRSVANEYLSAKVRTNHKIRLSPIDQVNDMLVADKVQNYKDFMTYHSLSHIRSAELDEYFHDWFKALKIDANTYKTLCNAINKEKPYEYTMV